MEHLDDLLFVLACALRDVERQLSIDNTDDQVRRCLDWALDAARPLLGAAETLRTANRPRSTTS